MSQAHFVQTRLDSEKSMHLMHSSTRALLTVSIFTMPDGGFHHESTQTNLLTFLMTCLGRGADSKVASGGHPHSHTKV